MRLNQRRELLINLAPMVVRADGGQLCRRHFQGQVEIAGVADVDRRWRFRMLANQKRPDLINRLLSRRQPDPRRQSLAQGAQSFQRQRQVRSALVAGQGMNFIDDYRLDAAQPLAAFARCQQQIKRLGRRDENVRRVFEHRLPLSLRRVACADGRADRQLAQPCFGRQRRDFSQRRLQIALNIVAQRLERRDINNFRPLRQLAVEPASKEPIDADQKGSQRLAGTSRSRDQRVFASRYLRPAADLRLSRLAKAVREPLTNKRMEEIERHPFIVAPRVPAVHLNIGRYFLSTLRQYAICSATPVIWSLSDLPPEDEAAGAGAVFSATSSAAGTASSAGGSVAGAAAGAAPPEFFPRAAARISSMLIPLPPGATFAGAAAAGAAAAGFGAAGFAFAAGASALAAGAPPAGALPRAAAKISAMLMPLPPGATLAAAPPADLASTA